MTYKPMSRIQGGTNIRLVDIPANVSRAEKGRTKYDDWFNSMIICSQAAQIPEDELEAMKKAAFRFMQFNDLKEKLSFRQKKDVKTKTYVVWFKDKE